jgi:hypothetical protein
MARIHWDIFPFVVYFSSFHHLVILSVIFPSVMVEACLPFHVLNNVTDFCEIWYEHCAIVGTHKSRTL